MNVLFRQKNKRTYFEFGRHSYEAYVLMSGLFCFTLAFGFWPLAFSLSLSALWNSQPVPGVGRLPVLPIEGKMPEWAEGVFNSAAKIRLYFVLAK